ncbi:MAG: hypothetical protein A3C15_03125 [Candidatus Magasanikbacteria bacterium RIFCSPHIGHO2_02_FULL_50_9b]|uniref:Glycosyltransferase RgtA/B/C/D-like domain-containing protein n=1 Tax=Candidatus Magasanikbacteria bacterium RIFCSPHIGHO2_02_FULL_50_9b TaxID=1798682 RepID=A0A1F6M985_9BACT|nr:MAG: hypothetical protein A3C15_03125 [Candidatus Magasanikbacteria bacterium RIFCSPHIGHO2_02_FULL_50_9b]
MTTPPLYRSILFWIGLCAVAVLALVPHARIARAFGSVPPVVVSIIEDDRYYFSRSKEIADGNFFIGNPYYIEHADDTSPAFFVSDWIAAVPHVFGFSANQVGVINLVVWSVIFFLIVLVLLQELGATRRHAIAASLFVFIALYAPVVRPVSMQIVFPFFLLFCVMLVRWLKEQSLWRAFALAAAAAVNFYIYTFSWQIIVVALAILFLRLALRKDLTLKKVCHVVIPLLVLSAPAVAYMIHQTNAPFYWETMERIGLVATRLPTAAALLHGVALVAASALWYLCRKNNNGVTATDQSDKKYFFVIMTVALCITALSNIVTAKELELGSHVGRFMDLFSVIIIAVTIPHIALVRRRLALNLLLICLIAVTVVFVLRRMSITRSILSPDIAYNIANQAYAGPLQWLETEIKNPSVILANADLSEFIPVMTKHYVAFYQTASLQLISNQEQIERYLISRPDLIAVDRAMLHDNVRVYAGTGPAIHQYKTHNRFVRMCRALRLNAVGADCGEYTTAVELLGEKYFADILKTRDALAANFGAALDRYHIEFLLIDTKRDPQFASAKFFPVIKYNDGRFIIRVRN